MLKFNATEIPIVLRSNDEEQEERDENQRSRREEGNPFPDRPNCTRNGRDLEEFKHKNNTNKRADVTTSVRHDVRPLIEPSTTSQR